MMEKIDHIGVIVKNIEAAIKIYQNIGFTVESKEVIGESIKVAFLPIGETYIELIEPSELKKDEVTGLDVTKEGIHHIAIKVTNIDEVIKQLDKSGIELLPYYNPPQPGARGSKVTFIDPENTNQGLLELVERKE
jgi:methylmalonyl-CoA/ethylmalonyl-CoA epimerase